MSTAQHSTSPILEAALLAHSVGLCVVPAATDGTKRPLGNWKQFQSQRPDEEQLVEWFEGGHPGMGIVCGSISGELEMLEFEGRMVARLPEVRERLVKAGLWEEFERLYFGYAEMTPSGGLHILYQLADSSVDGNTKIAMNGDNEVTIETRGEGGFVVVAPSNGPTHRTNQPWTLKTGGFSTIATVTRRVRDAIVDLLSSFDETPPAPPPTERIRPAYTGTGWVDEQASRLDLADEMLASGWTYVRDDQRGQLWRRPGKDFGVSGRINKTGRLHVFTTSTELPAGRTTYDAVDVALARSLGRPPSGDERVGYLNALRPSPVAAAAVGEDRTTEEGTEREATLDDDFWAARPWLSHIRDAAYSSMLAPSGVLGAVIARYAALVTPKLLLPGVVGSSATLDYIAMLIGPSGAGKSASMDCAARLLPWDDERILLDKPMGSGEGVAQAVIGFADVEVDGKKVKEQVITKDALHMSVDEGVGLAAQAGRQGTTITSTLCSAWSGREIGQMNASEDRRRIVPARKVRFSAVIGIQTARAHELVSPELVNQGFPQRIMCFSLVDESVPMSGPAWPGRLDVPVPDKNKYGLVVELGVDDQVAQEMRARRHSIVNGGASPDPLESHKDLLIFKTAAVFALMDGRTTVSVDDWALAAHLYGSSRALLETVGRVKRDAELDRQRGAGRAQAIREMTATDTVAEAVTERVARRLASRIHDLGSASTRDLRHAMSSRDRKVITVEEALDHARLKEWIVQQGDEWAPGSSRPVG
jgi:energy-coupling factor transporter ATP-binding protein EcfA2